MRGTYNVYVDDTGKQVKGRMRKHRNDIVRVKRVSKVNNHVGHTGHSFNFDNIKVLDLASYVIHIKKGLRESIYKYIPRVSQIQIGKMSQQRYSNLTNYSLHYERMNSRGGAAYDEVESRKVFP